MERMADTSRFTLLGAGRQFAGWLLVIGGGILMPLPIPVGLLLLVLGLTLLVRDNRWLRDRLRGLRARYPRLSARLRRAARHCPGWLDRLIEMTEPDRQADHGKEIRDP
jgi:hypothetical protein